MVLLLETSLEQLRHFLLVFHDEDMHRRHHSYQNTGNLKMD